MIFVELSDGPALGGGCSRPPQTRGAVPAPRDEDQVLARCRGRIASFKIPRHVVFVDDFPMTSSGKIQKVKLREEALRRLPSA